MMSGVSSCITVSSGTYDQNPGLPERVDCKFAELSM